MTTRLPAIFSASLLAAALALPAAAQDPAADQAAAAPAAGLRLAAGIDYRSVSEYFYFYPGGYAETSGSAFGVAVEGAFLRPLGERFGAGGGASLALGSGSADFTTPGPTTTDASIFVAHLEAFGEADFQLAPRLALLGRLGLGYTAVLHDAADESFTNLFLALGVHASLSPRVGVAALYQFNLAELGGATDAGVTSADPSLESHDNSAVLARVTWRM